MTIEEAPDRAGRERGAVLAIEQFGKFDQGDVHFGLNGSQDHFAIRFDVMRAQIAALRQGRHPTFGAPGANPTDGTRNRDAETLCRRVARQAGSRPSCVDGPFAAREIDVDDAWSGASMCPACLRGT